MKKAMLPLTFLVIFGIMGGMTLIWYASLKAGVQGNVHVIGQSQVGLLKTYHQAESDLLYQDLLMEKLGEQALYETLGHGRLTSPCGSYGGYPLFSSKGELCMPSEDEVRTNIQEELERTIPKYAPLVLEKQGTYETLLMTDDAGFKVIGIPSSPLAYRIDQEGGATR